MIVHQVEYWAMLFNHPISIIGQILLPARAIENQIYCIGVNRINFDMAGNRYNGDSAFIDS
ncbi:MAG TPA: hypothetical protein VFD91_03345 [Mariniphaga sp.]|nr:hypothetical protein [Mariniphaga sp.]